MVIIIIIISSKPIVFSVSSTSWKSETLREIWSNEPGEYKSNKKPHNFLQV